METADRSNSFAATGVRADPLLDVSWRDRSILRGARDRMRAGPVTFALAVDALVAEIARLIPNGRVYVLVNDGRKFVVGSLVSGVGIMAVGERIAIVRAVRDGVVRRIGWFDR